MTVVPEHSKSPASGVAASSRPDRGSAEPASPTSLLREATHSVRFFGDDQSYPSERIADFLDTSLVAGGAGLVFATRSHVYRITGVLRRRGRDVSGLVESGRLLLLDARQTAHSIVIDGAARREAFDALIGGPSIEALRAFGQARAYGEIVDVLVRERDAASALLLERWWNELIEKRTLRLLCGYRLASFADAGSMDVFHRICGEHTAVEPVESAADANGGEYGQLLARIQQSAVALHNEGARRQRVEDQRNRLRRAERTQRARAQRVAEHLARLQRFTSALSEAASPADIARVAVSDLKAVFGAERAMLAVAVHDRDQLVLFGQANDAGYPPPPPVVLREDSASPIAAVYRQGTPVCLSSASEIARLDPQGLAGSHPTGSLICMPVTLGRRRLGVVGLSYRTRHRASVEDRALLEDYVRQIGLALERARSYEEAERSRERLQLLADCGARIVEAGLEIGPIVETVAREIVKLGLARCCAIHLRSEATGALELVALHDADRGAPVESGRSSPGLPDEIDLGVIEEVARSGLPFRIPAGGATNGNELPGPAPPAAGPAVPKIAGLIVVPLRATGDVCGTLLACRPHPSPPFTAVDQRLLQDLADRAALSLENARLYERAQWECARAEAETIRAQTASQAKDEFLAMLGHELRNPLSPILTATQLMRLRDSEVFLKERTIIERQVDHLVRMIDDLLDVARITRGKVELKTAPVELAQVVANAIEMASPLLEERGHKLEASVAAAGLMVDVDASRLAQVIVNLLTNAARYTPVGGQIAIAAVARNSRVALSVGDNGIGMAPELLPRIFDVFVQGKQPLDRAMGGLGLGLAIARNLVELHGGTLRAASAGIGRGSTFTIELPLSGHPSEPRTTRAAPHLESVKEGRKVLIVDDNLDAARTLGDLLAAMGYSVRLAHDGPSALQVTAEFEPELALIDLGLPVMDGYELAERIAARHSEVRPKLIAVTGYGLETDRGRSRAAGFEEHLVKPVDLGHLRRAIEKTLAASG